MSVGSGGVELGSWRAGTVEAGGGGWLVTVGWEHRGVCGCVRVLDGVLVEEGLGCVGHG